MGRLKLYDALAILEQRLGDMLEAIYQLEKIPAFRRFIYLVSLMCYLPIV